jgi:hypothetical protein
MKKLKTTWKIEPGDGTGCSIQDNMVRNENGLCSIPECGKPLPENAVSYGFLCKVCEAHQEEIEEVIAINKAYFEKYYYKKL